MRRITLDDWHTSAILIQEIAELPNWFNNTHLYLDVETTSEQDKVKSINPWHNCKLLGIAIVIDNEREPLYIPLRHRGPNVDKNLPIDNVLNWLQDVLNGSEKWINHNIKYDAHVLLNEGLDISHPKLIDTLVLCRLAPREERFTYNLTDIMKAWYHIDIYPLEEKIKAELGRGKHDYGLIPIDRMCPYSAVDVLSVRYIYKDLEESIPEECNDVKNLELEVTPILLRMERTGMPVNLSLLEQHAKAIPMTLMLITREIERLTSYADMRPHTNADCKELIVKQYGLPVIERTEKKAPSFGSDAILGYKAMDPAHADVYDWILKYKELHKLYTGFVEPYLSLNINGIVHPDVNQVVRTGRMSMRRPNMQQLSDEAKEYIIPLPGYVIVDIDYSQIEYRIIAHFTKATAILKEYAENPNADYHQIVAEICEIKRKEAKRVNFCLSYNGGRGRVITILSSIAEIIERYGTDRTALETLGNNVYRRFHTTIPTLRPTSDLASETAFRRGYIKTVLKRHRYLPRRVRYKAFNTVIQGSAADLFKNAVRRVGDYLSSREDVKLIGLVHDSFIFLVPKEEVDNEVPKLISIIEDEQMIKLRVPIKADAKWSEKNWRMCK